jgi:hypothetical protein
MKFKNTIASIAVLGTFAVAGEALAADLAARPYVKAPPAPVFTWTGGYVGGQVGAGWGTSQTDSMSEIHLSAPRSTKTSINCLPEISA